MNHPAMRTAWSGLAFVAALACAPNTPAAAQQALVLSGGGARGLAHVGVLLRLEELGYDPDFVVGNSMGAVIGALYAAGYDAEQIRDRTLEIDWGEMFDPTPTLVGPDRDIRLPMLSFGLDLPERRVSRGLFGEWRINRALVRLLFDANARAGGDFDRLPRRYRSIAADLATGERVVLSSGDLALATRASMAYPGFFAPVLWQERVLIDGGIIDNLPTLEARRLGARHVIAVDVSRVPDSIPSQEPLSVAQRALELMVRRLHPDTVPPDILVAPATESALAGPAFPDDPLPLIELGFRAAEQELPPPAVRVDDADRRLPVAPDSFATLRIEAPDSALAALARQVFGSVAPGPYDVDGVLSSVDRLYSTGLFQGIWPRVVEPADSLAGPELVARLDAVSPLSLSLGAGFENDRGGRAWAALDHQTSIGRWPAVFSAAASTDGLERWAGLSTRVHALGRPSIAWSAGAHVKEHSVRTFAADVRSTTEVLRAGGWAGLEFPYILRERLITVDGVAEWVDPEDSVAGGAYGPRLRVSALPTQATVVGVPLVLEAGARWGVWSYRHLSLAGSRRVRWRRLRAAAVVDVRAVSEGAPSDAHPALGDQHAIPGLRWGEERGRARAVLGLDLALPAFMEGFARLRLRTGATTDRIDRWQRDFWVSGAQVGGFWRIPFGVLEVGYGLATTGDGRFDVSIGRPF